MKLQILTSPALLAFLDLLVPAVLANPQPAREHVDEQGSRKRWLWDTFDTVKSRSLLGSVLDHRSQDVEHLAREGALQTEEENALGLSRRDNAVETNQNGSDYIWLLADTYAGNSFYE